MIIKGPDGRTDEREVYFIEAEGTGCIKIGVANCSWYRMKTLDTMCPVKLTLLGIIPTDKQGRLEKEIHQRFAAYRAKGEWFHAVPEILDYIKAEASLPASVRIGPGGYRLKPGQPWPWNVGRDRIAP